MPLDVNRPDLVVGVVGTGAMGRGIAQVTAQGGIKAILFDAAAGGAAKAKGAILETLKGLVAKGRLDEAWGTAHPVRMLGHPRTGSPCNCRCHLKYLDIVDL